MALSENQKSMIEARIWNVRITVERMLAELQRTKKELDDALKIFQERRA